MVSDQSAVPDMSSSEKNFIGQLTIVCIHHRLDRLRILVVRLGQVVQRQDSDHTGGIGWPFVGATGGLYITGDHYR